ncbi:MAG: alcohol dehydrogenase catalytic domain-containing protein [Ruminococcaceae bacterium]|nr:alcohol dehydrogenase catalytic domain-containing protein [Oscillospiraceae bacterium]
MKAVKLTGVKKLEVVDIETPAADGVHPIMTVDTVGICGSDLHYWDDGDPLDLVMGHEFAGTIVDPGSRKDLKKGDRVFYIPSSACMECAACKSGDTLACTNKVETPGIIDASRIGAYAEMFKVKTAAHLYKIPDNISFEEASMVEPSTVAYHGTALGGVKKGDTVLVTGAGLIGAMTIQWAKTLGASKVVFSEINEARSKAVLDMGYADTWLNEVPGVADLLKKYDDFTDNYMGQLMVAAQLQEALGVPGGFDVVIDCSGNGAALNLGLGLLRPRGTVVWTGVRFHTFPMQHALTIFRSATIKAFLGTPITEFDICRDAIFSGKYPVKQYQTDSATLGTTQAAFEKLSAPGNSQFKIMVYPQKG